MAIFYLDTETTGLVGAEMVECAIVDDSGRTILDTLCNPGRPIPSDASRIHGITDADVAQAPPAAAVRAFVKELVRGHTLIIYNASYDVQFFPGIRDCCADIKCCMKAITPLFGEWSDRHQNYRFVRLSYAATKVGYTSDEPLHRAKADALACRAVWRWLLEQPKN